MNEIAERKNVHVERMNKKEVTVKMCRNGWWKERGRKETVGI